MNERKNKNQGPVSRKRQLGFTHSAFPNLPSEFPFPPPGHCREPPPWEHEASERIYHFVVGQTVHYQCAQGFRALQSGPAKSVCKMMCGRTRWTQPQLRCTSESKNSEFAGMVAASGVHHLAFSIRLTRMQFLTQQLYPTAM